MNKKLRRDDEARNLSREERKMTAIMRQIEEMEQRKSCQGYVRGHGYQVIWVKLH